MSDEAKSVALYEEEPAYEDLRPLEKILWYLPFRPKGLFNRRPTLLRRQLAPYNLTESISAYDVVNTVNGASVAVLLFMPFPFNLLAAVPAALIFQEYVSNIDFSFLQPVAGAALPVMVYIGASTKLLSAGASGIKMAGPSIFSAAGKGARFAGAAAAGAATTAGTLASTGLSVASSVAIGGGMFLGTVLATNPSVKRGSLAEDSPAVRFAGALATAILAGLGTAYSTNLSYQQSAGVGGAVFLATFYVTTPSSSKKRKR